MKWRPHCRYFSGCYTLFFGVVEKFLGLLPDIMLLMLSEVVVDGTKHAFITKFNNIPASVYTEYTHLLANDVITSRKKSVSFSFHVTATHCVYVNCKFLFSERVELLLLVYHGLKNMSVLWLSDCFEAQV